MAQEKKKPVAETHNPPVSYSAELGSPLPPQTETPLLTCIPISSRQVGISCAIPVRAALVSSTLSCCCKGTAGKLEQPPVLPIDTLPLASSDQFFAVLTRAKVFFPS